MSALIAGAAFADPAIIYDLGGKFDKSFNEAAFNGAEAWKKGKPALPAGRYLVKVYVDGDGKLGRDWQAVLGDAEFVGQAEVESRWPEGYGSMTVLDARKLRK